MINYFKIIKKMREKKQYKNLFFILLFNYKINNINLNKYKYEHTLLTSIRN